MPTLESAHCKPDGTVLNSRVGAATAVSGESSGTAVSERSTERRDSSAPLATSPAVAISVGKSIVH